MKRRIIVQGGSGQIAPMAVQFPRTVGSRRPIDKQIIKVRFNGLVDTQQAVVLTTVTFPCTIVGLRWDISATTDAGTATAEIQWAIVKVTEGNTVNTLATGSGSTLYAPEQNVMTWGVGRNTPEDTIGHPIIWRDGSKTGRKMMGGDTLQFIALGEATNSQDVSGGIQFFCRT